MAIEITQSELLEALTDAVPSAPSDAMTAVEIMAATGITKDVLRTALRRLHEAGRLAAHRVRRPAIDGRMLAVPAYTILPVKKKRSR